MKEKPILFSTPMVNAIFSGRKTMTRRIVKPQPKIVHAIYNDGSIATEQLFRSGKERLFCPYGTVGGRLWVRETWQDYCPIWEGAWCGHGNMEDIKKEHQPVYRADSVELQKRNGAVPLRWTPSIFMPRWASRITLEITNIRVERVNCMTESDAHKEGVDNLVAFMLLWDRLNKKRGYEWKNNCWVWVLEFQKV